MSNGREGGQGHLFIIGSKTRPELIGQDVHAAGCPEQASQE